MQKQQFVAPSNTALPQASILLDSDLSVDLKRLKELPTLPAIAMKTLQAINDERSSAKHVEAIIRNDPALSAKILRVANSAMFGFTSKVTTLEHAIALLGFNQVQSLLIGVAIFDRFRTNCLDLYGFWTHSVATAVGARFLAQKVWVNADHAFMGGLLHDIGKLAFVYLYGRLYLNTLQLQYQESLSSREAEVRTLGCFHTTMGSMMAEQWSLPGEYLQVIRHHHEPLQAAKSYQPLCILVGIANLAAHEAFDTLFAHAWDPSELEGVWEVINLPPEAGDECMAYLKQSEEKIKSFLSALQ